MANWSALRRELSEDPESFGYDGMDNTTAATALSDAIPAPRASITAGELYEAIDEAEEAALNNAQKAALDRILGLGDNINAAPGSRARSEILTLFGVGTTTRAELAALVDLTTTRAHQIGWGSDIVTAAQVASARA